MQAIQPSTPLPFSFELPYASQRVPILARQAVATSSPLAAQVGLSILERGGNAVDAAIAVAATLAVVEPTMNGLGGDAFAIVWDGATLHGLNASGRSPRAWSLERFAGRSAMPELGWDAVTVPGAISGWVALWQRFGSLPFAELLAPAIRYAREGFPILPRMAALWSEAPRRFVGMAEFARLFLPNGRAPRAGEWFEFPDIGATLESIADTVGESFYRGELARRIAACAAADGGGLDEEDLGAHQPAWVEPIGLPFDDSIVYELPPNGQGLAALIALGILQKLPIAAYGPDDAVSVHLQVEAMKLAFAECRSHVADPARMRIEVRELLSEERLAGLAQQVSIERAAERRSMPAPDHGTVYASIADRRGRMVSFIQSNYLGFGSGVVVPNTGISLQNRGLGFSLEPDHPNCVAGGVLPYHTIMPGFVMRAGSAAMSFGVMGGHMQPQGHVQLVLRTLLHRQNPQAAIDAPRWHVTERTRIALEPGFPPEVANHLIERGHRLLEEPATVLFGGAQAIATLGQGYCAASDPRKDGQAVGS